MNKVQNLLKVFDHFYKDRNPTDRANRMLDTLHNKQGQIGLTIEPNGDIEGYHILGLYGAYDRRRLLIMALNSANHVRSVWPEDFQFETFCLTLEGFQMQTNTPIKILATFTLFVLEDYYAPTNR